MEASGIHHIALRVKDCLASARFYESGFGLERVRAFETAGVVRSVWLRAGETVLMLETSIRGTGPHTGSGHVLIFPATDIAEAERRLVALGAKITDRTAATLYCEDPDGHRVGISTYRFEVNAS